MVIFLVIKVTGAISPQCPAALIDAPVDPGEGQTLQGEYNLITNAWSQRASTVLAEQRYPLEVSDGKLATWPTAEGITSSSLCKAELWEEQLLAS